MSRGASLPLCAPGDAGTRLKEMACVVFTGEISGDGVT